MGINVKYYNVQNFRHSRMGMRHREKELWFVLLFKITVTITLSFNFTIMVARKSWFDK